MSIQLRLDNADFDQHKETIVKLQFLPASVDEAATAKVDQFFNNYTTEVDGFLKNSLRGFPLNGCQFPVPDSHKGVIFQEDQRPLDENAERTFKVSAIFNEFTYWNYDKQPSDNDKLRQALGWNEFAKALHSSITTEEFEAEPSK